MRLLKPQRDLLSRNNADPSSQHGEIQHDDHHRRPRDGTDPGEHSPGHGLRRFAFTTPGEVLVLEPQRIGRDEHGIRLDEGIRIDQQRQPLAGRKRKVAATGGTDAIGSELLAGAEVLAAAGADQIEISLQLAVEVPDRVGTGGGACWVRTSEARVAS